VVGQGAAAFDFTDFSVGPVNAHSAEPKQRKGRAFALVLVALIVLVGGGVLGYSLSQGSSGNAIAGASPNHAMTLMTAAVQKAGSVHVVTRIQMRGGAATWVNDTGSQSGKQVITAGGAQVTILLVASTAYVNANPLAMSEMFQSSAAISQRFASKWLYFPSSSGAYQKVAPTLTLGSLLQQVTPTGALTKLGTSTVDGRSVIGVRGVLPGGGGTGTLYIAATGSPLPIEEVSGSSGAETTSIFSGWGEPVRVTPPSGAVPGVATGLF